MKKTIHNLQNEVRSKAGIPLVTLFQFTTTMIQTPETDNPYLYVVLDGMLRLHTPRLTEARRLMLDENKNVTEASVEVGYPLLVNGQDYSPVPDDLVIDHRIMPTGSFLIFRSEILSFTKSGTFTASSPICRPSRYVKNTSVEMTTSFSNSAKQKILFFYNQNNKIRT